MLVGIFENIVGFIWIVLECSLFGWWNMESKGFEVMFEV